MKTTTLYFKEGASDKVYQASIEPKGSGFVVNFAFGRRGSTLNTGTKTSSPVDEVTASKIFEKLVSEKKAKGYTEGADGTPYAGNDSKEHSGITPQLLNPIEEDQVERYVKNQNWCMQEKFDGKRLLLLKQGNAVLGINRKGLFIGIPESIKTDALRIPNDFLMDGEAVGDLYYVFDLLKAQGVDFRGYPYSARLQNLMVRVSPLGTCSLRSVITLLSEGFSRSCAVIKPRTIPIKSNWRKAFLPCSSNLSISIRRDSPGERRSLSLSGRTPFHRDRKEIHPKKEQKMIATGR